MDNAEMRKKNPINKACVTRVWNFFFQIQQQILVCVCVCVTITTTTNIEMSRRMVRISLYFVIFSLLFTKSTNQKRKRKNKRKTYMIGSWRPMYVCITMLSTYNQFFLFCKKNSLKFFYFGFITWSEFFFVKKKEKKRQTQLCLWGNKTQPMKNPIFDGKNIFFSVWLGLLTTMDDEAHVIHFKFCVCFNRKKNKRKKNWPDYVWILRGEKKIDLHQHTCAWHLKMCEKMTSFSTIIKLLLKVEPK